MSRRVLLSRKIMALLGVSVIAACASTAGGVAPTTGMQSSTVQLTGLAFDASVSPGDRALLQQVANALPSGLRHGTLVYRDLSGKYYSNRVAASEGIVSLRTTGKAGEASDSSGKLYAVPTMGAKPVAAASAHPDMGVPSTTTTTGPFSRVYSYGGYLNASALFNVPSAYVAPYIGPYSDTGYVYNGGWSSSGNAQVEGGFEVLPSCQFVPYFAYASPSSNVLAYESSTTQFQCNQNIYTYVWYEVEEVQVGSNAPTAQGLWVVTACYAENCSTDPNGIWNYVISISAPDMQDWTAGTSVMKNMVTIAQRPTGDQYDNNGVEEDGYYFGVDQNSNPQITDEFQFGFCYPTDGGLQNACGLWQALNSAYGFQVNPDLQQVLYANQTINDGLYNQLLGIALANWGDFPNIDPNSRERATALSPPQILPVTPLPVPTRTPVNDCVKDPALCE